MLTRFDPYRAWTVLLALVAAGLSWRPVHSNDAYWHLMLGRAVLDASARTVPEPTSFINAGEWIVVPEWLWGLVNYALLQSLGPPALTALMMILAAVCAVAVIAMLRAFQPNARLLPVIVVSGLTVIVLIFWIRSRPQSAFMALLPLFLYAAQRFLDGEHRWRWASSLIAMQIIWAQLHGSFVLGPALFAICAAPSFLRANAEQRRWYFVVLFGVLAGCLTSAYGIDIAAYILDHAGGEATKHIGDMKAPSWAALSPFDSAAAAAYLLLWLYALLGLAVAPRGTLVALTLTLLGVAMFATAGRFLAASAILLSPLALTGAATVSVPDKWQRPLAAAALAGLAGLLIWKAVWLHDDRGPLGEAGFAPLRFADAGNAYLNRIADGSAVLTAYDVGSAIGFWQHGRVKTFVDSRTPLHFDDTEFALQREILKNEHALQAGIVHYNAKAAVVARNSGACKLLAEKWHAVAVDPRFTTFAPEGAAVELTHVAACGVKFLNEDACAGGGDELAAEIRWLETNARTALTDYLHATQLVRCQGDWQAAAALVPTRHAAWAFRDDYDTLLAELYLQRGEPQAALDLLKPLVERGVAVAYDLMLSALQRRQFTSSEVRAAFEAFVERGGDQAPVEVRANLALVCMALGDAKCVRFHGLRATVRGSANRAKILRWLVENHPDPQVRAEALSWAKSDLKSAAP